MRTYFGISFIDLSRISYINDPLLRDIVTIAHKTLSDNELSTLCALAAAFEYAVHSIYDFLPGEGPNSEFFVDSRLRNVGTDYKAISEALKLTHKRIRESERFTAVMASGITLSQLRRFRLATPRAVISIAGTPIFQNSQEKTYSRDDTEFSENFVISCLIQWQTQGLEPQVPRYLKEGAQTFIEKMHQDK